MQHPFADRYYSVEQIAVELRLTEHRVRILLKRAAIPPAHRYLAWKLYNPDVIGKLQAVRQPIGRERRGPKSVPPDCQWCAKCDSVKALAEFARDSSRACGIDAVCKPCRNVAQHERQAARPRHWVLIDGARWCLINTKTVAGFQALGHTVRLARPCDLEAEGYRRQADGAYARPPIAPMPKYVPEGCPPGKALYVK